MSERRIQAKARVQVIVEVEASLWGADCPIGQLYKQASEEGINRLRNTLAKADLQHRIIGEPKVVGVITESEP